jgi:hypothetical protein
MMPSFRGCDRRAFGTVSRHQRALEKTTEAFSGCLEGRTAGLVITVPLGARGKPELRATASRISALAELDCLELW